MLIALGSTSVLKTDALHAALAELGIDAVVLSVKAASDIDEQPLGRDVTELGALNRARNTAHLDPSADLVVTLENGVMREGNYFVDRAAIVFLRQGKTITVWSQGVIMPEHFVALAVKTNLTHTCAEFMHAEGLIADPKDPHVALDLLEEPGVRKTRAQILTETLVAGLTEHRAALGL